MKDIQTPTYLAYLERNEALRRFKFLGDLSAANEVKSADDKLIQAIVDKRQHPPRPKFVVRIWGIRYILQRYVNGNAKYVRDDLWCPDKYIFEYPDIETQVRAEVTAMNEIMEELVYCPEDDIDYDTLDTE